MREYVDIPSRKDITKVRSWLSGAVLASPESRTAIPAQVPRVRKQKGPRPWRGQNNFFPINSNVYRTYLSFFSDLQSPWSRFPPTDKEGTASIHGDLPSAVSHAKQRLSGRRRSGRPIACPFLAANLGVPVHQSHQVRGTPFLWLRSPVGTALCHLMT